MIAPSPLFDEKKRQSLEIMFGSLCIITKIILLHHLKGSKYNNADKNVRQETKRGSNTNSRKEIWVIGLANNGKTKL